MINKKFYNHHDNPENFLSRVRSFCAPVTSTLGPGGMNSIIFTYESDVPHVTKDGVTIAESIKFRDPVTDCIASLIKESARKTAKIAGDGTTTSIVLTEAFLSGIQVLPSILNKKRFFDNVKDYVYRVTEYLEDSKITIKSQDKVVDKIINISSNGDKEIVSLVTKAFEAVPELGVVNVSIGKQPMSSIEIVEGMQLETKYFCVPQGMYDTVFPVVVEGPVDKTYKLQKFLSLSKYIKDHYQNSVSVLIAKEFSEEVKTVVQVNNNRGITNIALIVAEGFGANRLEVLKDIVDRGNGVLLSTNGATEFKLEDVIETQICDNFKEINFRLNEVILTLIDPTLTSAQESVLNKLNKAYSESLLNEHTGESSQILRRLTKYSKIANIVIGGNTEAEKIESKDRVDDAVCAARSAIKDGVLIGGGVSLMNAIDCLKPDKFKDDEDEKAYNLVCSTLYAPFSMLVKNAGLEAECEPSELSTGQAFDISTGEIVDALSHGILDPVNVTIQSVLNASSAALNILRSSVFIVEDEG